ncbi:MAG: murein hydrolase activator EnvC family protein [Hyphomonas sp.]
MGLLFRSFLLGICALSLSAAAPDTFSRDELDALESERQAAETKLAALMQAGDETETDLRRVEEQLIAAAMESQRRETQAADAEKSLITLGNRRVDAQQRLLVDQQALEDLLGALAASNRRKPPALVVSPGKANTAVRRAVLMSNTTPRLSQRAEALSVEIAELNTLERKIRGERARLSAAEATLAVKKIEIERLAAAKRGSFESLADDIDVLKARAESLGNQAGSLRELLNSLESHAPSAPGTKPTLRPKLASATPRKPSKSPSKKAVTRRPYEDAGKPLGASSSAGLRQPVAGRLLYKFGEKRPVGGKSEGLTFATRAEAQVVAPAEGVVEFARPFRSYGTMLILRTSDKYHVILMGMSKIYVTEGQKVAVGEPVGRMPDRAKPAPELNLELRQGDKVLNPAKWMPSGK